MKNPIEYIGYGLSLSIILVVGLSFSSPGWSGTANVEPKLPGLTFGVVPQQSASKLARLWAPILSYLSDQTGYQLKFKTARDIPTFEKRLAAGEYDLAYMNPYHYTVFHKTPGYLAFAKARNNKIKGIIVVRKDSEYQQLGELRGQELAFPSSAAFAASILPRAHLAATGIPVSPRYVASHDSVYRNIVLGRFRAGGGIIRTFLNTEPEIREKLRILWTSMGYTPHAFAAHSRISQLKVKHILQAMIAMDNIPRGKQLLDSIKLQGIEAAQNADWDDVRKLVIDPHNQPAHN